MNNTPKKTSNRRRHHYVQQAYLKNFACNKNKKLIWMMDKWEKEIFEKNHKKLENVLNFGFFILKN